MSIIRKTKPVQLILKQFNNKGDAISAIELIDQFKKNMDKTTVYRILDRLEDADILHSFIDQDGLKRYAKDDKKINSNNDLKHHPHFLCEDCGISSCLPVTISIPNIPDYTIKRAEHLLTGICKDCA